MSKTNSATMAVKEMVNRAGGLEEAEKLSDKVQRRWTLEAMLQRETDTKRKED